ncbi:hypothetical protein A6X21_22105 [Planctopirus hydrillae]|uniref:Serine protease n=1 Tax=Planctopirus hydrillae TaxID=1841610 RepID=A0A1C3EFI3_9PLAN|nr:hypothetical protein A6X21_22105 [Planctopirus hydrillae]
MQSTYRIACEDRSGTCFTIDVDGRQYIVTAKHVVGRTEGKIDLRVHYCQDLQELSCRIVGVTNDDVDIAVLATSMLLSPPLELTPTTSDLLLSQDVYFLGFPYGWHAEVGPLNREFPLPLVKKACVSMLDLRTGGPRLMLLDGHNNPGFSGGPVVFAPINTLGATRVAGVVSGYRYDWQNVYKGEEETEFRYKYNTGVIVAYSIEYAIELIRANPIGAVVSEQNAS